MKWSQVFECFLSSSKIAVICKKLLLGYWWHIFTRKSYNRLMSRKYGKKRGKEQLKWNIMKTDHPMTMTQTRTKTTAKIPKQQPILQTPWDFFQLRLLPSTTNQLSHQTLPSWQLPLQGPVQPKIIYHQKLEICPAVWRPCCSMLDYCIWACMCSFIRSWEISTLPGFKLTRLLIVTSQ